MDFFDAHFLFLNWSVYIRRFSSVSSISSIALLSFVLNHACL